MLIHARCLALALAASLSICADAVAPPAPSLTYQGRIVESGTPVTGTSSFTFAIADAGNNVLWTGPAMSVQVNDGLYAALITGFPASVVSSPGLRLRVSVGGTTVTPDVALVPSLQAITAYSVTPGAVGTDGLVDAAVTAAKLADGSVAAPAIAPAAVGTVALAPAAVTAGKVAAGAVATAALADASVTAAKLATDAVTAAAIADGSVTAAKLAVGATASLQASIDAVAARVSKLEGQVTMADLAGTYHVANFQTELGDGGYLSVYATQGTLTLSADGNGVLTMGAEAGHQLTLNNNSTFTRSPWNGSSGDTIPFTWTYLAGQITAIDGTFNVVAGGRLLVRTSANPADGTNVIVMATRVP